MPSENPWGEGTPRHGATDHTFLVWKLIEANPGITRERIWERVESDLPAGYAKRVYLAYLEANRRLQRAKALKSQSGRTTSILDQRSPGDMDLTKARSYVLSSTLRNMRRLGSVTRDESGGYRVLRPLLYLGNPNHVDVTGTKAADHLAQVYARRRLRLAAVRTAGRPRAHLTVEETNAFRLIYGTGGDA